MELPTHEPDDNEWTEGLTKMRTVMREETHARIVLGGRVESYKGRMPASPKNAFITSGASAIFLLGGFGGCTRDIAEPSGWQRHGWFAFQLERSLVL